MDRDNNNNLKQLDHDVPDGSSSDDNDYSELLELMVKFGKKEMENVKEEARRRMISLIDWIEKSDKLKDLKAMKAQVFDRIQSKGHASIFRLLMTLTYPEDKQVIAAKFREFVSSSKAKYQIYNHVENYPELMDIAGTELKKIKEQYPNQVGTMSTASELDSTAELFPSLDRGLTNLLYKLKMIELHVYYSPRLGTAELG